MSVHPKTDLTDVLEAYLSLSKMAVNDHDDESLGLHEHVLATAHVTSWDDMRAKALYISHCHGLDPALVPRAAVDTLLAGVELLAGGSA